MKDFNREKYEEGRPQRRAIATISHCLDRLFEDNTHTYEDQIVDGLNFEELIGALLQGRDLAEKEEGS